jgi:hypothetical protein
MSIYESIQTELNKKNINVQIGTMYDMMAIWKSWYRGSVNDFHYYMLFWLMGQYVNAKDLQ